MTPRNIVLLGDCIERLRELDADSVDAIVTDPPYGLEFMGKAWDGFTSPQAFAEWCRQWGAEALRVLKPGGYLLAFGGTRTYHRLVSGLEDAGFEIRDTIAWLYGSGFPKSLDVSKAIDKAAGILERPIVGEKLGADRLRNQAPDGKRDGDGRWGDETKRDPYLRGAVSDAARTWSGFGTALKPAHEPIVVARKPLTGTVAANVERYGTGALNIDGCRVGEPDGFGGGAKASSGFVDGYEHDGFVASDKGRWPANVAHDGSVEVLELFPQEREASAARFFYCAKASRADREAGLVGLPERPARGHDAVMRQNDHPTVKPNSLMRWLVRLVGGQPGSLILDPFAGSGSTLRAARAEGFNFLGIERDPHYYRLACLRAGLPDPGEVAA